MPAVFPLLAEAQAFRLVGADGWPIYRRDCAGYAIFYAPGCLCVVNLPDADRFEAAIGLQGGEWEAELWHRATVAQTSEVWETSEVYFSPECLTLYMNNECNLRCAYCHTDPSPKPTTRLELDAIVAAGELVAASCRNKGRPFYIVFHGGGEPTLHRERVEHALARLESVAAAHQVEPFRYVATNGVMPEDKVRWLARHFDLIGLSCDGPADIQNAQRPLWGGQGTAHIVERTAHILRDEGCRFHARTTITNATLHRQAEIADYICQRLAPEEIHFEPVYVGGRTGAGSGWDARQASEFAAHFWAARKIAQQYGILLTTSGSRPGMIHGPYCHVFGHVVNLAPGDVATACFKITDAAHIKEKGAVIGAMNRKTGHFEIDRNRVRELRQLLSARPPECEQCFNRYHCVRDCPDRCPLDDQTSEVSRTSEVWPQPGFRCQVLKALTWAMLQETAERLWATRMQQPEQDQVSVYGTAIL